MRPDKIQFEKELYNTKLIQDIFDAITTIESRLDKLEEGK